MALFNFRTRNPGRDRETDLGRFDRLLALYERMRSEMQRELDGLQRRYSEAQTSAAFAMAALENGDGGSLSSKVDDLSRNMERYDVRIEVLKAQIAFIERAENSAGTFLLTLDPDGADPGDTLPSYLAAMADE